MLRLTALFCLVNICLSSYSPEVVQSVQELKELHLAVANNEIPSIQTTALGTSLINTTLNAIKEKLAQLDPISIESTNINVSQSSISLDGVLSKVSVSGISDFVATKLSINLFTQALNFTISLPKLSVYGDYDLDGSLVFIPIYGKGSLAVDISNVEFSGNTKVTLSLPLTLSQLDFAYNIENIKLSATGIINNEELSELVSEVVTDVAADFLNDISKTVSSLLASTLQDVINKALANV